MNALELLKRDHDMITSLLEQAGNFAEQRRAFTRIKSELEMHAYAEETLLYPILQKEDSLKALVDDAAAQHRLMRQLLDDLEKQDGVEFEKTFQTLRAEAQLHFVTEENEIFPQVARLKSNPDLTRLGERLENDKKTHQGTGPA